MAKYNKNNAEEDIFESSNKRFLLSTGEFPEEICFKFSHPKRIKSVIIEGRGLKKIAVETSEIDKEEGFKTQAEQNDIPKGSGFQNIKLNLSKNPNVLVIRIKLIEGYEDFFTIRSLDIQEN